MIESKDVKQLFNERFNKIIGKDAKQKDVAEKIGTTRQTVSNWISGNAVPDMSALVKIASAYHISVDYLLGLTDQPTNNKDLASAADYLGISENLATFLKDASKIIAYEFKMNIQNDKIKQAIEDLLFSRGFRQIVASCTCLRALCEDILSHDKYNFDNMVRAASVLGVSYNTFCNSLVRAYLWSDDNFESLVDCQKKINEMIEQCDLLRYDNFKMIEKISDIFDKREYTDYSKYSVEEICKIYNIDEEMLKNVTLKKAGE